MITYVGLSLWPSGIFFIYFFFCLSGLHPATGDSWDNEVSELTKTLLENQAVRLCVKAVQDGVHQVTITSTSGEDVGQALVDGGKAVCQSGAKGKSPCLTDC